MNDPEIHPFRQGLRDLGYVEGKNILIEYRYAEGKRDRIPELVAELVHLKVDVTRPSGGSTRSARPRRRPRRFPLSWWEPQDPVDAGLVDSLAHPGGNITGLTRLTRDLSGKRLELLKEAVPNLARRSPLEIRP